MRIKLGVFTALAVLGLAVVQAASASAPVITRGPSSGTYQMLGICAQPFTVTYQWDKTAVKDLFDNNGVLREITYKFHEQDTFVGPTGITLSGPWYSAEVQQTYDSAGSMIADVGMGNIEEIYLPDGSLFFSAGRTDFMAHGGGTQPVITADHGTSGDVAALCTALAAN
jgi:hypothetical protein